MNRKQHVMVALETVKATITNIEQCIEDDEVGNALCYATMAISELATCIQHIHIFKFNKN